MRIDIIVLLIHLLVVAVIDYKQHIIPDPAVMSLIVFKLGYDLIINLSFIIMLTESIVVKLRDVTSHICTNPQYRQL